MCLVKRRWTRQDIGENCDFYPIETVGAHIVRPRVFAIFRGEMFGMAQHAGP